MISKTPNYEISTHKNIIDIGDDLLEKVIDHEREVYGYKGFGEYLFCTDPKCRRIQSIDEVYGVEDSNEAYVPLRELEKSGAKCPDCPDCKSPTLLIFNPEYFKEYYLSTFRESYAAILRDKLGEVQGISIAQPDTLRRFFDNNMNYKQGLDWPSYLEKASEALGDELDENTEIVGCNRISISRPFRGGKTFFELMGKNLNIRSELDNLPGFGSTRYDGALYKIICSIGYEEIDSDPFGDVAIGINRIGRLREAMSLSRSEFREKFNGKKPYYEERGRRLAKPPEETKHYVGVGFLDEFQSQASLKKIGSEMVHAFGKEVEVPPEIITEVADFFRELFSNEFRQYIFYPSEGRAISPAEASGAPGYTSLSALDEFDLNSFPHPKTGEKPVFWHDPETVEQNFQVKLKNGQLAISRDKTKKVNAMTFGYVTTLMEAFESEEWQNPFNYSLIKNPAQIRDFGHFQNAINKLMEANPEIFGAYKALKADSDVYVWNSFGVHPNARGEGLILKVSKMLGEAIPEEIKNNKVAVLEAKIGSKAHVMYKMAGGVDVPNALEGTEASTTLMVLPLAEFVRVFSLPKEGFRKAYQEWLANVGGSNVI